MWLMLAETSQWLAKLILQAIIQKQQELLQMFQERHSSELKTKQIGCRTELTEKYNLKLMKWEQKIKYKSVVILP